MRGKIYYGIVLLAAFLLFMWTNVQVAFFFLIPMLILIPVVIAVNIGAAKKAQIAVYVRRDRQIDAGAGIEAVFEVSNPSMLPLFRLRVCGAVKNLFTKSEERIPFEMSVAPKGKKVYRVFLKSMYCGRIDGEILEAWSYDFLGLERRAVSWQSMGKCYVYPESLPDGFGDIEQHLQDTLHTENRYLHRKGNDITEILDIRDYQKGDNMKTIHWKLSKKMGRKVVRELDMPANQEIILFAVISAENQENGEVRNRVARTLLGISSELLAAQMGHDAVLFSESGNVLGRYSIEGAESRDWFEHILLDGDISFEESLVDQYILRHNVAGKYASILIVTDAGIDWGSDSPGYIQMMAQ